MRESYRLGLDVEELLRVVARLLRAQRRADALLCRYLADLADGLTRWPGLVLFYGDVHQLARYKLGLSLRSSRERVRIGRALRQLPVLCAALMDGDLAYSRIREVTRVARPDNERQWLQAARELSMRQLEQRVVAAGFRPTDRARPRTPVPSGSHAAPSGSHAPSSSPSAPSGSPEASDVSSPSVAAGLRSLQLPQHVWVLLERAMLGARERSPEPLTDVEAVECVVRAALTQQAADGHVRRPAQHGRVCGARREAAEQSGIDSVLGTVKQSAERAATEWTDTDGPQPDPPQLHPRRRQGHPSRRGEKGELGLLESGPRKTTQSGSAARADRHEPPATQSGSVPEGAKSEWDSNVGRGRRQRPREAAQASAWGASASRSNGEPFEPGTGEPYPAPQPPSVSAGCGRRPLSEDAKQLLNLIKGGKLWNVVTLSSETGMPLRRLTVALTDLEFARRVSRDPVGFYEVVAGEGDDDCPFPEVS